jgi:hypothetical protein
VLSIPLHAYLPRSSLSFASFVHFGDLIVANCPVIRQLTFTNNGTIAANVQIVANNNSNNTSNSNPIITATDSVRVSGVIGVNGGGGGGGGRGSNSSAIVVSPSSFVVGARSSFAVSVTIHAHAEIGPLRSIYKVMQLNNNSNSNSNNNGASDTLPQLLDISATLVDSNLQFVLAEDEQQSNSGSHSKPAPNLYRRSSLSNIANGSGGGSSGSLIDDINFGSLYFGLHKVVRGFLINNSPSTTSFNLNLSDVGDNHAVDDDDAHSFNGSIFGDQNDDDDFFGNSSSSNNNDNNLHSMNGVGHNSARSQNRNNNNNNSNTVLQNDVYVVPSEGKIEPYSQILLTFYFSPHLTRAITRSLLHGWKHQHAHHNRLTATNMLNPAANALAAAPAVPAPPSLLSLASLSSCSSSSPSSCLSSGPAKVVVHYSALARVEASDGKNRITVSIAGTACIPQVYVEQDVFHFGHVSVGDTRQHTLQLYNLSPDLALPFSIERVAQYSISPMAAVVPPRSQATITISFQPHNRGTFNNHIQIVCANGAKLITLQVFATSETSADHTNEMKIKKKNTAAAAAAAAASSIGSSKKVTINDLQPLSPSPPSYVRPSSLTITDASSALLSSASPSSSRPSSQPFLSPSSSSVSSSHAADAGADNNSSGSGSGSGSGNSGGFIRQSGWGNPSLVTAYSGRFALRDDSKCERKETYTLDEAKSKQDNRSKYDEFLKNERLARLKQHPSASASISASAAAAAAAAAASAALPTATPSSFASGLREPVLSLPSPDEHLRLRYNMSGYIGTTNKRRPAHKHSTSSGSSSSKQQQVGGAGGAGAGAGAGRLLKSAPSTQAEKRDCETALTASDLQSIIRGPKLLEFGRLCVNGRSSRIWKVTNELEQHIQVMIKTKTIVELADSQPSNCMYMIPPGTNNTTSQRHNVTTHVSQ